MDEKSILRKHKKLIILQVIINYKKQNGFAPSYREIAELSNIRSISTVSSLFKELEKDGTIQFSKKVPRSLVVL